MQQMLVGGPVGIAGEPATAGTIALELALARALAFAILVLFVIITFRMSGRWCTSAHMLCHGQCSRESSYNALCPCLLCTVHLHSQATEWRPDCDRDQPYPQRQLHRPLARHTGARHPQQAVLAWHGCLSLSLAALLVCPQMRFSSECYVAKPAHPSAPFLGCPCIVGWLLASFPACLPGRMPAC